MGFSCCLVLLPAVDATRGLTADAGLAVAVAAAAVAIPAAPAAAIATTVTFATFATAFAAS